MPALVNYSGENELYHGKPYHPKTADSNSLSYADVYGPPHKRVHVSAPVAVLGDEVDKEKQTSIESLPEECLFEILRRLPGQERSVSTCVSKHWLGVLSCIRKADICNPDLSDDKADAGEDKENRMLTRCLEGKKATDWRLLAMAVGTASRGGLGRLSVNGSKSPRGVTDFGVSRIARGCPALKYLSLKNVPCVGDEGLSEVARGCPLLKRLDLCNCPSITNEGLVAIAEKCPNLSALTIESCSGIGNDGLQAIVQRCAKLEMISIKDSHSISDLGIASLTSSSSLTKVKLNGVNISDYSLAIFGHYGKSFVHLSLSNLKSVSQNGFWLMGNGRGLHSLMSLEVTSCSGLTDPSIIAIGNGCPSLKQISLHKCCFLFDRGLASFSRCAVSLESMYLEEINGITLFGIIVALSIGLRLKNLTLVSCAELKGSSPEELKYAKPCRSVRSLSVRNCPGFGNTDLAILGMLCPELRQLDLSGLFGVTDEGLLSLIESCEGALVKLSLNGCPNLSDRVITAAVRDHGDTIKKISLEGCQKLTDVSLVAIAKNCQMLEDLDLSSCAITDYGIAALSSAKQLNLEILSLYGCRWLTDKSARSLSKTQDNLIALNLQRCNSITNKAIAVLVESLCCCDIIY